VGVWVVVVVSLDLGAGRVRRVELMDC